MKTIFALSMLVILVIILIELEKREKQKMKTKKRPCEFIVRRFDPANCQKPIKTIKNIGLFHQFGTETSFGSNHEPSLITVAIVEDETGQVHTLNPNEVKFTDK